MVIRKDTMIIWICIINFIGIAYSTSLAVHRSTDRYPASQAVIDQQKLKDALVEIVEDKIDENQKLLLDSKKREAAQINGLESLLMENRDFVLKAVCVGQETPSPKCVEYCTTHDCDEDGVF